MRSMVQNTDDFNKIILYWRVVKHRNEEEKAIHTKVSALNTLVKCEERNGRDAGPNISETEEERGEIWNSIEKQRLLLDRHHQ